MKGILQVKKQVYHLIVVRSENLRSALASGRTVGGRGSILEFT